MTSPSSTPVRSIDCPACGATYTPQTRLGLCDCGGPLLVHYDLENSARHFERESQHPSAYMWQWRPVMPLPFDETPVTLGEGGTPLLNSPALAEELCFGKGRVWIKDESVNPTASFKSRGLSAAVTMAHSLGVEKLIIPTAGNAGGALAAYAARAGMKARVIAPRDVPQANADEVRLYGAELTLIDGLIDDCGKLARSLADEEGYYDVSTLKEPYRIEGKKTMGYELAAALDWRLPDVILYPTGGGTGLIGMWKAFDEMEALGWIDSKRPRMVSVQAAGCAPIVRAFHDGAERATRWEDAATLASGLRVPAAVGDRLMLEALRASEGEAVAVSDEDLMKATYAASRLSGVGICPEAGACVSALVQLRKKGYLRGREEVVVFNTGAALKYFDVMPKDQAPS